MGSRITVVLKATTALCLGVKDKPRWLAGQSGQSFVASLYRHCELGLGDYVSSSRLVWINYLPPWPRVVIQKNMPPQLSLGSITSASGGDVTYIICSHSPLAKICSTLYYRGHHTLAPHDQDCNLCYQCPKTKNKKVSYVL